MPYNLNSSSAAIEQARLEFPKVATRQEVYRYYGVFTGTTGGEIFIDGNNSSAATGGPRRLLLPANCSAIVSYDLIAYEFVTATGAFQAGAAALNGKFGATTNAGTATAIANPVAPTLSPTAQTIATVTPSVSGGNIIFTVAVAGTGATTTKVVEILASVYVANRAPLVTGLL